MKPDGARFAAEGECIAAVLKALAPLDAWSRDRVLLVVKAMLEEGDGADGSLPAVPPEVVAAAEENQAARAKSEMMAVINAATSKSEIDRLAGFEVRAGDGPWVDDSWKAFAEAAHRISIEDDEDMSA